MSDYQRDRKRVDRVMRQSGVCVVMNKDHVKTPEHMVTTMCEVHKAGYVAEITFRIDAGILREGMKELVKRRDGARPDDPFILGVGSVINPKEMTAAIDMGFDMIVAPGNVMGGYGEGKDFVKAAHDAGIFAAPAILSPTELQYFLERDDGLEPDAIKVFPAGVHGPKGISGLLAPYARDRHNGKIIMPTGGVNYETGPEYVKAISARGYAPVLGMSAPLAGVKEAGKPGDPDTIRASLKQFAERFSAA